MVLYLPTLNLSPLDFITQNGHCDIGSHESPGPGKLGAIATESAICSRHGIEMFEMGGNAADAVSHSKSGPMRLILNCLFRVGNQVGMSPS